MAEHAESQLEKSISKLHDARIKCLSILVTLHIDNYIELVSDIYTNRGGLEGQRGPLKTKTAISIRARMVDDIQAGAVLPPIVVGILCDPKELALFENAITADELVDLIRGGDFDRISIIDGMQRTTAILDALRRAPESGKKQIRVEFWISDYLNSLVYRMLVLNTGQVPWELSRQLETVYSQLLKRIRAALSGQAEIFLRDDTRRRSSAGQYQSRSIIELFLIFSSRRTELDVKDIIAEDFARIDTIETTSHFDFLDYFIETLRVIIQLDHALSRYRGNGGGVGRFEEGKDIFASFPAMAGFVAAVSTSVFSEPGFGIVWSEVPDRFTSTISSITSIVDKITATAEQDLEDFLQLDVLNQRLSRRTGQVGRFERDVFKKAFSMVIRPPQELHDLAPCWLAQ